MTGTCSTFCPITELIDGINARTHRLEEWRDLRDLQAAGCQHYQQYAMKKEDTAKKRSTAPASSLQSHSYLLPLSAYRRSAAGTIETSHESLTMIRSISTLYHAAHHLFQCILSRSISELSFADRYHYIADRARQIKKELTISNSHLSHPFEAIEILEMMTRFYIIAQYMLFGADVAHFDRHMNDERTEDCLQYLLECYGHAIKVSSFPDSSSSSSSSSSTRIESLSSLRLRCDRFRAYLILSKLNGPWLAQLQQMLMKDKSEDKGGHPSTESASISSFNSSRSSLSPPIHLAVQFCVAFHFNDYSRFFKLYRRVCQPDDDQYYEPIVMALLQVHLLPLQIVSLRHLTSTFQPNTWFPLADLQHALCLPSIPDVSVLCKSLCSLTIRRPDEWNEMSLAEQERDEVIQRENEQAHSTGNTRWAVEINRTKPVKEADPIVFKSYYQRELKRRITRFQLETSTNQVTTNDSDKVNASHATPTNWDDELSDHYIQDSSLPLSSSSSPLPSPSPRIGPLYIFFPSTQYPPRTMIDWVTKGR